MGMLASVVSGAVYHGVAILFAKIIGVCLLYHFASPYGEIYTISKQYIESDLNFYLLHAGFC